MKVVYAVVILLFGVSLMAQTPPPPDTYGIPHLGEALANAEARYQAGGPGVTEEELVTFHNHIVDILKLPDFARLDKAQLRNNRMVLTKMRALGGLGPKPGESQTEVTHTLSPMAAAILEDFMILQKRFNAGDQMAPGEWTEQKMHERSRLQDTDQIEGKDSGVDRSLELDRAMRAKGSLTTEEAAKLLYHLTATFKLSTIDAARIAAAVLEGK